MKSTKKKLALSLIIASIAIFYTLPNFFGQQPALQIKAKQNEVITQRTLVKIKDSLKQQKFDSIKIADKRLVIKFNHPNEQLAAKDHLNQKFPDLTIALYLANKTPKWLLSFGSKPMKLGLDLRGGVHFLLNVDTKTAVKNRIKQDASQIKKTLRQEKIKTISSYVTNKEQIHLSFFDEKSLSAAKDFISKNFKDYEINQQQKKGNLWFINLSLASNATDNISDYTISQTITTINNRINELGVSEASIARQGKQQISVDLPGIQDIARAKALLGKTATLRFHLVDQANSVELAEQQGSPLGSQLYYNEHNQPILLKKNAILTGDAITYASTTTSQGLPAVSIRLGGGKEYDFHRTTSKNIGRALAVIYVDSKTQSITKNGKKSFVTINKEKVISVATIQSALGQQFEITGLRSFDYADNLSLLLRSGSLAAPVSIIQETTIGPSLGKENITKGILSLGIGSICVVLFMLAYYRLFGLIANCALVLNIFLIIMALSLLGATLTLPGIAGIVLTVGMAVDANVLINERIREELRLGLSPLASIKAGYEKAFSTIIDSNITTLIVALILFTLGSGTVKGFAITLTIGLIASMFTAIFFTRLLVDTIYNQKSNKTISIGI